MNIIMIIGITFCTIGVAAGILALITKKSNLERIVTILTALGLILSSIPYITPVPIGNQMVIYNGSVQELEKMENNYAKTVKENAELKKMISEDEDKIKELEDENQKVNQKIEEYKDRLIDEVEYLQFSLFKNDDEIAINQERDLAMINSKLYLSENAVGLLTNKKIGVDQDNNIVYIGKYPETTVDLLETCPSYDVSNLWFGEGEVFSVQGKTFMDGFKVKADGDGGKISFRLDSQYNELTFNAGHIDGTDSDGEIVMTPYLDGKKGTQITLNSLSDFDTERTIALNGAKILRLEWVGTTYWAGEYGFSNLKLK